MSEAAQAMPVNSTQAQSDTPAVNSAVTIVQSPQLQWGTCGKVAAVSAGALLIGPVIYGAGSAISRWLFGGGTAA